MNRRTFLMGLGASAITGARALGAVPQRSFLNPTAVSFRRNYKVLEIFLAGAASHRDTLWVEAASSANRPPHLAIDSSEIDWTTECGGILDGSRYAIGDDLGGEAIHLGPCAKPLNSAGWLDRARVAAIGHDRPVHELGQWHGLTGQTFGRSTSCGMGALVEQHVGGTNLNSWLIASNPNTSSAIVPALRTIPDAPTAPVFVPMGDSDFTSRLARSRDADPVRAALMGDYSQHLQASSGQVRSSGYSAYAAAATRLAQSDAIQTAIAGRSLSGSGNAVSSNESRNAIRLARQLLAGSARYVCVIDSGGTASYDSHLDADEDTLDSVSQTSLLRVSSNLASIFEELAETSTDPNDHAIDLDTTLVVVHSDFGRTFRPTEITGHWSAGYSALLIGGPIKSSNKGVVGGMYYEETDVDVTTKAGYDTGSSLSQTQLKNAAALSPTDLRVATLYAAGLDPVADGFIPSADLHSEFQSSSTPDSDLADAFFTA